MEVITPVIKVDVGESQQTVKGLKKEISELKDRILNLTKGTDEYNEAVVQLQERQRTLNEVMALTKKEAVAVEGSYDALTHQMALLRKEWKATADEARRNEIGQQIAEINAQLKEMDASVGNFQRNVGNYVSHWEGMPDAVDDFGDSVRAAAAAPKDFGTAMREMNEQIEPTKQKFEAVGKISSGIASGFAAVQGTMALLNIESENLEKALVKVQSAMAIAQGVKGIGDLVEGVGKAKVAFAGLIDKVKAVSKAMGAAGWIGVIVAVTTAIIALVSWIKKTKDNTEDLEKELEKLSEKHKQMGSSVGNAVGQFKIMQREFMNLKTNADKQKWIDDNAQAFSSLGLAINDVNDANKTFIENSPKIIEALKLQAEAAALNSIYQSAYGEAYAKKRDIDARKNLYTSGYEPTDEEKKGAGLSGMNDFQTYTYTASSTYGSTGTVGGTTVLSTVNAQGAKKLAQWAEDEKKKIDAETNAILEEYTTLQEQANAAIIAAGITSMGGGNKGGGTKTPAQIRDELVAEIQAAALAELSNMVFEDDFTVEEEEPKKPLYEYKDGDAEKRANIRIAQEERIANRQIELNNMVNQSEEERAAKEFEIRQALEQKKLDLLKQFREQALAEGDILGAEELAQQIADKEIEIEKAKYDEMYRLRAEYAAKTTNAISQASQITQGILEITQAAYEKDEEITEKEAKRIKGLQIAIATMNMLQGITSALSGVFTTHTGVWDIAMAAAQATSIAAAGTANIMKIKNTDLTGSVPSGAMGAVTPNSNIYGTDIPYSYTRQLTGASETDSLNEPIKVYVTESDISNAVNHSKARVEESSF